MAVFTNLEPNRFNNAGNITENAEKQRVSVSRHSIANTPPVQPDNGDINASDKRGTFTKGLVHDQITGLVDLAAVAAFQDALSKPRTQVFTALENIDPSHLGAQPQTRAWVNPVAGRAFGVLGGDPQQFVMPVAPAFGSDELSFEILENYWMALLRDVPFHQYKSHPQAAQAAQELNAFHQLALAELQTNKPLAAVDGNAQITPQTLFRGLTAGDKVGPYQSQFLIHPVPFGVQGFHQRNKTLKPGRDFMTDWQEWVAVQNGAPRDLIPDDFDEVLHYMRNGRDLSQWVHIDVLFQAYFNACLMMLQKASAASSVGGGVGAEHSSRNPYHNAHRQQAFATLGDPGHIGMMCEVAASALKAVWFQKWYVHLRFRPEAYGGRIAREMQTSGGSFNLPVSLMQSQAIAQTIQKYGSPLLPMAFPEGSPMHPAYGAGHATVAGACVTVLKALFKGDAVFPNPVDVVVDRDGQEKIVAYTSADAAAMTMEGELNKLASNIALGRNMAGVHWRSDGSYSLQLGEDVAISILEAYARSYAEFSPGAVVFEFKGFDGTVKTITA